MSGALSILATGAGLVSLADSIINGNDGFLILGNVAFNALELPAQMPFGGTQSLVKHDLPGGVRTIDAMGAFSRDAQWSGIFFGSDAVYRAQAVDAIRKAGVPVPLSWDVFYYSVVVSSFDADYHNPQHVTYSITCTVLQDMSDYAPDTQTNPVVQAYYDINMALGLISAVATGLSAPATACTTAQTALQGNAMIIGSSGYVTALSATQNANTATVSARDAAGTTLDASSTVTGASAMSNAVTQAGVAAGMAVAAGYTGRAVVNATIGAV